MPFPLKFPYTFQNTSAYGTGEYFRMAIRELVRWNHLCHDAEWHRRPVGRAAGKAGALLEMARRAGLSIWYDSYASLVEIIGSPLDLAGWCEMQLEAAEVSKDSLHHWQVSRNSHVLHRWDVIHETLPIFWQHSAKEMTAEMLSGPPVFLRCGRNWEAPEAWAEHLDGLEFPAEPEHPGHVFGESAIRCGYLVAQRIAAELGAVCPVEPVTVGRRDLSMMDQVIEAPPEVGFVRHHLEIIRNWCLECQATPLAGAAAPTAPAEQGGGPKAGKRVNARMLETIHSNPEAMGWTCQKWAEHLRCSKPSIVATAAWKDLQMGRERQKAESAQDRRRRGHPRLTRRPRT